MVFFIGSYTKHRFGSDRIGSEKGKNRLCETRVVISQQKIVHSIIVRNALLGCAKVAFCNQEMESLLASVFCL